MKWRLLVLTMAVPMILFVQNTRIRTLESQVSILSDCCQRQELRLKEMDTRLEALRETPQEATQPLTELVKKYAGYFDDHDVSGLLED